ncbi:hypothetical protein GO755_13320 [Spirosoma sp. HMF4905]|uniref:HTH luxR-type domain-containing protein n=1 Tax=Spirosoma arboris TaxID=2682092 RepID=A0A7K1SB16_9BACT|nr:LuxR C-terminal-related transcriptional regulator [Spirosoma arboris]MVM31014.1 hypothetical protein [Spirosoma arboris]
MQLLHRSPKQIFEPSDAFCLNQGLSDLTRCEWKILLHVATDLTNLEIAEKLCLTPKSVENYRTRIGTKLDLKGWHKLAKFARKHADELRRCYQQEMGKLPPK